tara:strand:- start:45 stop:497 length:453 start_codon:yes stop_codon:yes gene_type:complete
MKKRCRTPLFLVLIFSLLLFSGCTEEQTEELQIDIPIQEEVPREVEEQTEDNKNSNQEQEIKEFDITASNWKFEPSTINVNKGDKVILHIVSTDVEHGFAINEFNIDVNLKPGQTVDIEFIANKKGEFLIFCNVFCGIGHSDMEGTLIVN